MPDHSLPKEDMLSPLSSRSCLLALGIQSHTQPRAIQHSWSVVSVRLKGSKTSKKGSKQVVNEEEEGGEDDDPEKSVNIDETEDDPSVPQDYKDLEKAVQLFRYDLDLDMVKVGDTLDLVVGEDKEGDIVTVMRVVFKKVSGETTDTDR